LCTFRMHATVLEQVDKYIKHCLWRGSDVNAKKTSKSSMKNSMQTERWGGIECH
jgi:hypothetical protein